MFHWLLFHASCEVLNHSLQLPMNNWLLIYGYGPVRVVVSFSRLSPLLESMTKMTSSLLINSPGVQGAKEVQHPIQDIAEDSKKSTTNERNPVPYAMVETYLFGRWFCPSTGSTILPGIIGLHSFPLTVVGEGCCFLSPNCQLLLTSYEGDGHPLALMLAMFSDQSIIYIHQSINQSINWFRTSFDDWTLWTNTDYRED